jgi:hypothetical protein
MMSYAENKTTTVSGGCGCLPLILTILTLWALWFGLPTPWGEINIDIFPPAIRSVGVVAQVTKPAPEKIQAAIMDEAKNDAPMAQEEVDNGHVNERGSRQGSAGSESGIAWSTGAELRTGDRGDRPIESERGAASVSTGARAGDNRAQPQVSVRKPQAIQALPRTEAIKVASVVPAEVEDLCPKCTRCLRPCTDTPHVRLQCTDPLVIEMSTAPFVYEYWCMQGGVEVCKAGKAAPPEGRTPCVLPTAKTEIRVAGNYSPPTVAAKMEVQSDSKLQGSVGRPSNSASEEPSSVSQEWGSEPHSANGNGQYPGARSGGSTLAYFGSFFAVGANDGAGSLQPAPAERAEASQAATQDFGWYVAVAGDKFCPRTPLHGWCDNLQPAKVGATYLTYAGRLTHVTLQDCGNEHVLEAISQHWPNVHCIAADGKVARYNTDDAKLTPIRVFSDHDRIMQGRVTEETR